MDKTICELFAGVGGFRLGFEKIEESEWKTVWFSQWEPGASKQWAHECYVSHFGTSLDLDGEDHTGEDIASVDKTKIPDHTLLVGGFPCQDYSVAHSLSSSQGIEGKKGVLWWEIYNTIIAKQPPFCLFENVDRLLKSPARQRGRDFGVMLSCLSEQGYSVEWRVVNAAVYGAAQRRRRVFIFAYRNETNYGINQSKKSAQEILMSDGLMAKAFPISGFSLFSSTEITDNILKTSDEFKFDFKAAGYMNNNIIYTAAVDEIEETPIPLKDILVENADESLYISKDKYDKFKKQKDAKKINRKSRSGHEYVFSEGAIAFPEPLDKPSRTMLTSESTLNRSTHVIKDPHTGDYRILDPIETERLQGFDDDWTNTGMPKRMRYFCMGNALVVPMIKRMAEIIDQIIDNE